jgi:hypothetical protein
MKKVLFVVVCLMLLTGCSELSQLEGKSKKGQTSLAGSWTITATNGVNANSSVFNVNLVSSPCTVKQSGMTFTIEEATCVIADNPVGQGSITGTGNFMYPPQGVLLGAQSNPAPQSTAVSLIFVEADGSGNIAVFDGNGQIASGSVSGSWTCDPQTPVCSALSGTFNGTQN